VLGDLVAEVQAEIERRQLEPVRHLVGVART
jgi:hypothetical protein